MNDDEASAILRVIASADEFEEWASTQLLSRLQISLPARDWFLLAATEVPGWRVWDPHDAMSDEETG